MAQDRLLETAIREFGTHGYEGVSTRQIACAAGTAMSTITYHYGGKEQLYHAAAERVASDMAEAFAGVLDPPAEVRTDERGGARDELHRLLGRFVEKMANAGMSDHSLFIVREQMSPTAAFDALYSGLLGRLVLRLRQLVGAATGCGEDEAAYVALTLMGQAVVLRSSRATVLRLLAIPAIDTTCIADFRAQVAFNIDAILDRMTERQGMAS